jgi:hypothetical protein
MATFQFLPVSQNVSVERGMHYVTYERPAQFQCGYCSMFEAGKIKQV